MQRLTADQPETQSLNGLDLNLNRLKDLFPEAFGEGGLNFDVLKELLGGQIDDQPEKYGLTWNGKARARRHALTPTRATLRPDWEGSVDWDSTQNLMIEGDNLEVLKLLRRSYAGKVKLIYIDPPYNTGKDFVYPDDYSDSLRNYQELTGQLEEGRRVSSNTENSGRFHTDWLNMMYPRLKLARELLSDDGFIAISIDDNEAQNIRNLANEVLGEENFEGVFIWQGGRKNDSKRISSIHDYIYVYSKNISKITEMDIKWREKKPGIDAVYAKMREIQETSSDNWKEASKKMQAWFEGLPDGAEAKQHSHYKYLDQDGVWYPDNISSPNPRPNLTFEWKGYDPPSNGWRYDRKAMQRLDDEGLLLYPDDLNARIQFKRYLHNTELWNPASVFYRDRRAGSKQLSSLMQGDYFDFPKDVETMVVGWNYARQGTPCGCDSQSRTFQT